MFFKKSVVLLLLLITTNLTSYADETSLTAKRPKAETFKVQLHKEASTINIPVEIGADELSKILNRTIGKELYKGSTKTKGLSTDVTRNGTIVLSAADNFIYITLPVTMKLNYSIFETSPIPLKLKFRATATVTPDWKLQTTVFYLGVSDLLAENIGIGALSLKPRSIIDGLTQPLQKILSDMVTQKINTLLPIKAQIAKVWDSAQSPILLDKTYKTWLTLTPQEAMLFPPNAVQNKIKLSIGISTFADVVVGPEPLAQQKHPLPKLKIVNSFDKTFRIALNADIFYKDLRGIMEPLILNKPFDSDGKQITIKDFELYGNGEKLVIKLITKGSLDGTVYLTAKPTFNPKTNIFSVEDVDFDMQTQSLLLNTADWFLHGTIKGIIQEKLNMNLTEQLDKSRQIAAKSLSRKQLMEHLFLQCNFKNLKFKEVLVQKDKISIQVYTEGESAILFQ